MLVHGVHADAPTALKKPTLHAKPVVLSVVLVVVSDALTVSMHGSALAAEHKPAVTVVPGVTPEPASTAPTLSAPAATAETVSVVPANAPVALAAPEPAGQKAPAGHGVPVDSPAAQYVPAAHALAVDVALPVMTQKPGAHESAPAMTALPVVCESETVYVPTPPLPVPSAVMAVPTATPVPESVMPTSSAPDVTADTVSVVLEMEPVTLGAVTAAKTVSAATICDTLTVTAHGKALSGEHEPAVTVVPAATPTPVSVMPTMSVPDETAATVSVVPTISPETVALGKEGAAPRPAGQKKPTGHAFVLPAVWPATQKKPAGHGTCATLASRAGQKEPGAHGLTRSATLPVARQKPAKHAEQTAAPPALKKPTGQGMLDTDAAGQKEPAVHEVHPLKADVPTASAKVPAGHGLAVPTAAPTRQ